MSTLHARYRMIMWCTASLFVLNSCGNAPIDVEQKSSQVTNATMSWDDPEKQPAMAANDTSEQNKNKMIDLPPKEVSTSRITSIEDRLVSGTPTCIMNVQYRGVVEQVATFSGAYCKDTVARFVNHAQLSDLGYAAYLSVDEEDALNRAYEGKSLLVTAAGGESGTVAILFPLNEMDIITKVVLSK